MADGNEGASGPKGWGLGHGLMKILGGLAKGIAPISIIHRRTTWQGSLVHAMLYLTLFGAIGYLCYFVVDQMTESNPEIDNTRKEAVIMGVSQMVTDIRSNAKDSDPKTIAVAHFAYDPSDYVTEHVREALDRQGRFQVVKRPIWDRFCRLVGRINDGAATREQAIKNAGGDGVEGILWGRVGRLENEQGGATFTGDYELFDLRSGRPTYSGKIHTSTSPARLGSQLGFPGAAPAEEAEPRADDGRDAYGIPWHVRLLLFLVVMLLLPVMTIAFIRTMVAKKSNGVNAFVLGIYTSVDLILAFFAVGGSLSSAFSVALFALASIVAFLYNVKIMSFAVRLEE